MTLFLQKCKEELRETGKEGPHSTIRGQVRDTAYGPGNHGALGLLTGGSGICDKGQVTLEHLSFWGMGYLVPGHHIPEDSSLRPSSLKFRLQHCTTVCCGAQSCFTPSHPFCLSPMQLPKLGGTRPGSSSG